MIKRLLLLLLTPAVTTANSQLQLNEKEYFETQGLNVMVFQDYYPVGHQGGVSFIQNGKRVATNGDLRFSSDPGQWQPVPKMVDRVVDPEKGEIRVHLSYPDEKQHLTGFNPLIYPEVQLAYQVSVVPLETEGFRIVVDLAEPLPEAFIGKVGFNLEFFPPHLAGESYFMGDKTGLFPQQAHGPIELNDGNDRGHVSSEFVIPRLGVGRQMVIAPGNDEKQVTIKSVSGELELVDGRLNHNNGWLVVRENIPADATQNAIVWEVVPRTVENWLYDPVFHFSQVGYHPEQQKHIFIELDPNAELPDSVEIFQVLPTGEKKRLSSEPPKLWGQFLRYNYVEVDATHCREEGLYQVVFGDHTSRLIRVSESVYEQHVWQPTLEYFLPVQMCHMKVSEKYRIWHDRCHMDDALMAPTGINHFDGYTQDETTYCDFEPLEQVPGLNVGGWHDAGDYDLRVESQINTVYTLCLAYEAFRPELDQTLVDQETQTVEIHHPDGVPDMLQQIEHGLLSVVGGYEVLGRLYRGIITPTLRQYVMLGDAASMSDGVPYVKSDGNEESDLGHVWYQHISNEHSQYFDPHEAKDRYSYHAEKLDDRLVFTEENPRRSLDAIGGLAAASRVLKKYNPDMAKRSLKAAEELWNLYVDTENDPKIVPAKFKAVIELILSTEKQQYIEYLNSNIELVAEQFDNVGYLIGRVLPYIKSDSDRKLVGMAAKDFGLRIDELKKDNPFQVPYKPNIWGAGWSVQRFGMRQYFLHKSFPGYFPKENMLNALNFVLGSHPGENTASFVSGVGSESVLVAYGVNRGDWSYIPGGSVSGTALIRPDFPELLEWPFLWQQTEYVMGGGATHFLFLALAAQDLFASQASSQGE